MDPTKRTYSNQSNHVSLLSILITARGNSNEEIELSKKSLKATYIGIVVAGVIGLFTVVSCMAGAIRWYYKRRLRRRYDQEAQHSGTEMGNFTSTVDDPEESPLRAGVTSRNLPSPKVLSPTIASVATTSPLDSTNSARVSPHGVRRA